MNEDKKSKILGIIVTLLLHILVAVLLWLTYFGVRPHEEESGILVMVGVDAVGGGKELMSDDVTDLQPDPSPDEVEPAPTTPAPATPQPTPTQEPLLSQDDNDAPYAAQQKEKELKERQAEEARLLAQAEAKRQEELRKQQEEEARRKAEEEAARKKAEEEAAKRKAINNQMAGLFNNRGTGGDNGVQGAENGNSITTGAASGSPGYGKYDLGGRGMAGALPRPTFNKNISGIMVVTIWVDSDGNVKEAHAGAKGSTISDTQIRVASEKAAMQAKFTKSETRGLTQGTITYYFDSNN